MKKYMIKIVGETLPYIIETFNTREEAQRFIEVLEEQDRSVLGVSIEYCIKEIEG